MVSNDLLTVLSTKNYRAGGIRTRGLFVPNEALYQAEPQPVCAARRAAPLFAYFGEGRKQVRMRVRLVLDCDHDYEYEHE